MRYHLSFYKLIPLFFLLFISSTEFSAQVNRNRIQNGIIRLQSFVGQNIHYIGNAEIKTSVNGSNTAYSNSSGRFQLDLNKLGNDNSYYITSVHTSDDRRKDLELMFPLTTDRQEYTTQDLVIIMSSKSERDAYVNQEIAKKMAFHERQRKQKEIEWDERYKRGELEIAVLSDSLTQFRKVLENQDQLIMTLIRNTAEQTDFETSDSCNQAIALALYEGRIDLALKLYKQSEPYYEQLFEENANRKELIEQQTAVFHKIDKDLQTRSLNGLQTAYLNFDFKLAKQIIQQQLQYNPLSREWLIEMGKLEEIVYNNYPTADSLYRRALKSAISDNANADVLADLCNKIADVFYMQSQYEQTEEWHTRALDYLKTASLKDNKPFFDAHAGLGKLRETFGRFDEAETYYKSLIDEKVNRVSSRAHLIGCIGIAQLLFERGRIQEAQQKFESLIQYIENNDTTGLLDLRVLAYMDYAECLHAYGRYNKAIELCDKMLNYVQSHSVGENYYVSEILIHRAASLYQEGRLREAKEDMNRSMEICQNILGDMHPKYAVHYAYIAGFSQTMGDMEHAKEFSEKALQLFEQKFGQGSLNSVSAHQMLINCYINSGDYDKAIETIELIRSIYKKYGVNNPLWYADLKLAQSRIDMELGNHKQADRLIDEVIDTYCSVVGNDYVNLISLYNQKGNMAKTAGNMYEWYTKAEKLTAKVWGEDSRQMALQRVSGANKYFADGEFQKCENIYLNAEKILLETYSGDNYNMVFLFEQLSGFYEKMKDYNKAESYKRRAYETTRQTFGDSHPYLALQETSLGTLYQSMGRYEEGKNLIMHADSILTNKYGINHKNTFQSQLAICSALASMGNFEEALTHIEKLRKNVLSSYGKDNLLYSNILGCYSTILNMKGDTQKAIEYAKEIQSILERNQINDKATLIEINSQLSTYYINIGDWARAIRYNEIALKIANEYYGKDAFGTMPILFCKANLLYNDKDKIKEAKQIYRKVHKAYTDKYGANSPETYSIKLIMANMKMSEGYFEESVDILKGIKENMEVAFGKESINLCQVLDALGNAYLLTDSTEVGLDLLERSLSLQESYYGRFSRPTLEPLTALCNAYMNKGDITKAKLHANRALMIAREFYGYDSPLYTSIDAKYGILLLQEGNVKDAYKRIERYNQVMVEALKDGRVSEFNLCESYAYMSQYYQNMAMMARNSGDNEKAEYHAELALSNLFKQRRIITDFWGEESANNIGCLSALASTYYFMQNADSAIVYAQKGLDLTSLTYGDKSIQTASAYCMLANVFSIEKDSIGNIPYESLCKSELYIETALDIYKDLFSENKEKFLQNTFMTRVNLADIKMNLTKYDEVLFIVNQLLEDIEFLPNTDNGLIRCKLLLSRASAYACNLDKTLASESLEEALRAFNILPVEARNAITMNKHQTAIVVYFFLHETQKWKDECNAYLTYLKRFPNTESLQKSFLEYMNSTELQIDTK